MARKGVVRRGVVVVLANPMGKWLVLPTMFVVVGLLYARAPDAFSSPQFFGEDASVFWVQWRELGLASFWKSYAGYLDLYNRLGAALTSLLPIRMHPAGFMFFTAVGYAWTAATIATARLPVGLGPALAVAMMLTPNDPEVLASLVNVHWIMACAIPVIASTSPPEGRCARINQLAFMAMISLTGPFVLIAIPIWAVRAYRDYGSKDRFGLALCAIAAAAAFVQLNFVLKYPPIPISMTSPPRPVEMLLRMIGRSGLDYLTNLAYPLAVALLCGLVLSPLFVRGRWQRLSFLAFALLILIPVFQRFYSFPEVVTGRVAGRYFFIPCVMILWTALSLLWSRNWLLIPVGIVASLSIVLDQTYYSFVREPREVMDDWASKSALIGMEPVTLKFPPGWTLEIKPRQPPLLATQ